MKTKAKTKYKQVNEQNEMQFRNVTTKFSNADKSENVQLQFNPINRNRSKISRETEYQTTTIQKVIR